MPAITQTNSFLQTIDIGLRGLLYTKFEDILSLPSVNKGVILYPKDIALRKMAEKKGNVELDFINVWRTEVGPDWSRMNTPAARRGASMNYLPDDETKSYIAMVKRVPVKLKYDVSLWTTGEEKAHQMIERYLWWQFALPALPLNYVVAFDDIDFEYPINLHLHFGPLKDEGTIREMYNKGRIFCMTAPVEIDGYIFAAEAVPVIHKIVLTTYDKDSLDSIDEMNAVVVEDSNQEVELESALRLFVREYTAN